MFQGGIFLYPNTRKYPLGKLRLLYEANPLGMIVEQAGGKAINCKLERILEIQPRNIHEKTTVVMGSHAMVEEMMAFVNKYSAD
jgi:fructose-1,6-bisphosphatase I